MVKLRADKLKIGDTDARYQMLCCSVMDWQ